jgi:hypothetical protein
MQMKLPGKALMSSWRSGLVRTGIDPSFVLFSDTLHVSTLKDARSSIA